MYGPVSHQFEHYSSGSILTSPPTRREILRTNRGVRISLPYPLISTNNALSSHQRYSEKLREDGALRQDMKFPKYDENGDPILPEGVKQPESLMDVLTFDPNKADKDE